MRRFLLLLALLMAACGGRDAAPDAAGEWRGVLLHKRAAAAPNATARDKQAYADALGAFVARNPSHGRAREVYERIQIDFARDLAALGRYQDAIRVYRAVLAHDPRNDDAARGLSDAVDRLAVTRAKLVQLERGMSQHDVARLLGKPIPGWTETKERPDATIECWYYRTSEGGVAGVYFRDGALFAAEEKSHEKLVPLTVASTR
jgi:tetratricopeptide (TPR) repeat protein